MISSSRLFFYSDFVVYHAKLNIFILIAVAFCGSFRFLKILRFGVARLS